MSTLKARIIQTHDIQANWELCPTFIPKRGEIIVYDRDPENDAARIKIGDGVTKIGDLPFLSDSILGDAVYWDGETGYIDSGEISSYG